jgi:hypothetical protein
MNERHIWPSGTAMMQTPWQDIKPDGKGHRTRFSDSSMYDEKCVLCGGTDAYGDARLNKPCINAKAEGRPAT